MQAVLYTKQLEPITVVRLSQFLWQMLERGDMVQVPVLKPYSPAADDEIPKLRVVRIFGEPIRRGEHSTLMLFTQDEEHALLLRAEFLPGQHGAVQRRERTAFANGFLTALLDYGV